jgi:hypothetical protein
MGMLALRFERQSRDPEMTSRFSSVNVNSLWAFCYQYPCQVSQIPGEGRTAIAVVLKREAIMQHSFANNSPIAIGIGVGPLIRSNAAWPIF